ncbi:membrane solute-binding protein with DNA binding domains [Psychroflexus torquis ATCC 700755]|uniref:Membrane solute-binding protein with DNA binding domains n=1 Tax=Psychroflexus torquis (strain ATCC 700755 / CIP 106069 / ACAM 623) TaxID=313595 RepID=K4IHM6_PSYTT|nr:helix-hairpin-helix domain-containing protein [Psychroflexus torquis]AFU69318.1 membrane solute-binding protein with DNA binding domains [Psychroflexus torquis ATCC 700755]
MNSSRKFRFGYTKGDRNGIFLFSLILTVGIATNYFSLNTLSDANTPFEFSKTADSLHRVVDSLKKQQSLEGQRVIYPFNPNFVNDYKGYTLEMTTDQIDRLHEFRAKKQWINSNVQFQKVTGVSDQWMTTYSPYFKFPDWVIERRQQDIKKPRRESLKYSEKKDLNTVEVDDLILVSGIGETLANRILRYRSQLGGFVNSIQLKDVYGLKSEVIERLEELIVLKTPLKIEKQDFNTISVLELSELPYFDYEMSRSIVNFIKLRENISNFEELSKIEGFPSYKLDRIQLYLEIIE